MKRELFALSWILMIGMIVGMTSCQEDELVMKDQSTLLTLDQEADLTVNTVSVEPVLIDPWQSGNAESECEQAGECCSESELSYKFEDWSEGDRSFGPISITNNDGKNFDWSSNSLVSCVIVVRGNIANVYYYCPDGALGGTGLTGPGDFDISHVTFCYAEPDEELTVSKTVVTSFTREHSWDIDKNVETQNEFELDDGTAKVWLYIDGTGDEKATWTVDVTYKGYDDDDFNVSGEITIENTGTLDAVITSVDDVLGGTAIDCNCGVTFPYTLAVGETLTCTYDEDGYFEGDNVVTVTTEMDTYSATEEIVWDDPDPDLYAEVEIIDTNPGFFEKYGQVFLDAYDYEEDDVVNYFYSEDFAWADYGADDCGSFTYDNTATIVETEQSADATLKVNVQCFVYDTAYAKGDPNDPFCNHFSQWGWTNPIEPGTYTWDLWAGAAQCDISKGTLVGTVDVVYDWDGYVTVTFNLDDEYDLKETHVYAGDTMFPKDRRGRDTVAPGQYTNDGPFEGEIYVIVHAVVGVPDPDFGPEE
jgi:hypothetical protein